jgi:uncharacterized protein (UPF0332 family)/predicted nucleotidyltransferase
MHLLDETRTPYLTDEERRKVAHVLDVLATVAAQVERVILFGSKARGDEDAESDVDLLVVTRNGRDEVKRLLGHLTEDDPYLQTLVFSAEDYQTSRRLLLPLYVNVRRDGVELWAPERQLAEAAETPIYFPEGEPRVMDEASREVIRLYLEKAHRALDEAQFLSNGRYSEGAISRAYYAAFYAATAALYAVNVVRGSHSGIQGAFSQFLVRPGLIEKEYKDILNNLFKYRQTSDYEPPQWPSPEQTPHIVADATRFIAHIEQFLRERGALSDTTA